MADTPSQTPINHDLIHGQIERLLRSEAFGHSELHRKLLSYLAEKALSGEADTLKEYAIGLDVLGRAEDYDPGRDSSTRMQVARLREKLAAYYRAEGAADPILVELPKGHFKMVFREQTTNSGPVKPESPVRVLALKPATWLTAAGLFLLGYTAGLAVSNSRASKQGNENIRGVWTPALERFWQPFLDSRRPVLISIGTPLFLEVPSVGYFRFPGGDGSGDWQKSEYSAALAKAFPGLGSRAAYGFTGIGEAGAVFELAKLLGTRRPDFRLVRSNLLSWDEIASSDVIFVGPPKFNLKSKEIPIDFDFVLERTGIRNARPHPGEPAFFDDVDYRLALITKIPGLHGQGEILILASNSAGGTLAAAQYMTRDQSVRQLVQHLKTSDGNVPQYFQVILKSQVKDMTPVHVSYLLHHGLGTTASALR